MQKTIRSTRICAASMCLCQGLTFSSLEQKCALQLTCYATAGGRLAAVHEPRMAPVHVRPACLAPGLTRHGFLLGNHVHGQHGHGSRCLLAWGSGRGAPQNPGRLLPGPSTTCPCPSRARARICRLGGGPPCRAPVPQQRDPIRIESSRSCLLSWTVPRE